MTVVPDEFARSFTAEDLSPSTVELFLRGSGWRRVQLRRDVSAVWENAAADASVMVPHNRTFRDYRQRLTEALITISDVHGNPPRRSCPSRSPAHATTSSSFAPTN